MAIYIHCPNCHQRLEAMRQDCAHCGVSLPPGVLYALSASLGLTPLPSPGAAAGQVPMHVSPTSSLAAPALLQERHTTPTHHSTLRPWLAALLSVICGLGQLYNGQILKGAVLLLCGIATVVTWHFVPVKVLAPCLWLYAIADAYLVARRVLPPASQRRQEGEGADLAWACNHGRRCQQRFCDLVRDGRAHTITAHSQDRGAFCRSFSAADRRGAGQALTCVVGGATARPYDAEHSVILTLSVAAVDDAQTPDRRSRYTWHSEVPTSGCC